MMAKNGHNGYHNGHRKKIYLGDESLYGSQAVMSREGRDKIPVHLGELKRYTIEAPRKRVKPIAPGMNRKLVKAVLDNLSDDPDDALQSLKDVAEHGVEGGFPGFTYYTDTVEFYKRNKMAIVKLLQQEADDSGQDPVQMVRRMNCVGDDYSPSEISKVLYGAMPRERKVTEKVMMKDLGDIIQGRQPRSRKKIEDVTPIANCLAWFALEAVAHAVNPDE
jgi:hypothetical protein